MRYEPTYLSFLKIFKELVLVVLGVWKGVPYAERFCRGCDLGKVEDEKHLLLVFKELVLVVLGA
jgi:hypothetical protein